MTLLVAGPTSPASASDWNLNFDAYCNSGHTVTAWAPDMSQVDGRWAIVWATARYRYTSQGWTRFRYTNARTVQGGAWITDSVAFTNLPTGYYQVRDTYVWTYNGASTGTYGIDALVPHLLDGVSSYNTASSWPTLRYSTASYCYMA